MQHPGAKREMGEHQFQMGGRAPLASPLATALTVRQLHQSGKLHHK